MRNIVSLVTMFVLLALLAGCASQGIPPAANTPANAALTKQRQAIIAQHKADAKPNGQ